MNMSKLRKLDALDRKILHAVQLNNQLTSAQLSESVGLSATSVQRRLNRLRAAGVGHAEWTRHCTYADPARFYSYRRTTHAKEADYGRLISCIRL